MTLRFPLFQVLSCLGIAVLALAQCTPKTADQSQDSTLDEARPQPQECTETSDPMLIEWMEAAVKRHEPYQVYKYRYLTDGWAYYYLGARESFLYDCQGLLLCSVPGKMLNDCARKVQNLGEGELIYSKE